MATSKVVTLTFAKVKSMEEMRQKRFATHMSLFCLAVTICVGILTHIVPSEILFNFEAEYDLQFQLYDLLCGALAALFTYVLIHLYRWGLTTTLKLVFVLGFYCWLTATAVIFSTGNWHFGYILVLDFCLVVRSERDAALFDMVSIVLFLLIAIYVALHSLSVSGLGPDIHPSFENRMSDSAMIQFVTGMVPTLLNFFLLRSYAGSARQEAKHVNEGVEMASQVAQHLANFNLDAAEALLSRGDFSSPPVQQPLSHLLRNLRTYRPFLPNSLFVAQQEIVEPPNDAIAKAMEGEQISWEHAQSAVRRLRDPDYSLQDFRTDVESAFPELKLYNVSSDFSSGLSGMEEYQRTMGAFYSIYCLSRLDIDGKNIFAFGVDAEWRPLSTPGDAADKRNMFYECMDWDKMVQLLVRADLLRVSGSSGLMVNSSRMMAFLVLTAVHDVMKNSMLLPKVQKKHAPYRQFDAGDRIADHDIALAYVMEYFSGLLPSFHSLEPGQRAPILFTQSKMGFNNGWLVQGEAPPGALFSTFKRVIVDGGASQSDISFYFAHWLTDLAGAEPYNFQPWPGSEKFVLKFPVKVLAAFLESFGFVDRLAMKSEVEVMEEYLQDRWSALGPPLQFVEEGCELAAMRVALMAQGFESQAVASLLELPQQERDLIAVEMARTGHRSQFRSAQARVPPSGPAFLVYYAPALIQKAGVSEVFYALLVLASVYGAARQLFPLEETTASAERTVIVRIDALKVLTPAEIMNAGVWHLRRTSDSDAEAVRGPPPESSRRELIAPLGLNFEAIL